MSVFGEYAEYYNAFYGDKDYKKEAEQVDRLIRSFEKKRTESIIDFGCGTGKHILEFIKMGYQCVGVDRSKDMIRIAKENAKSVPGVQFYEGDVRFVSLNQKVDAVVSLFHVMSYQNTNEDVRSTIRSAKHVLNGGGVFIFDAWYGPGVITHKPEVRVKEVENERHKLIRYAKPLIIESEDKVIVNYEVLRIDKETETVKSIREAHHMRYFFRLEMEEYLNSEGFELVDNLDCTTLKKTDFDSWTCYFIARLR